MRSFSILFIALLSLSFSCNNSNQESKTLTVEEKETMYQEAEKRALDNIEQHQKEKSFAIVEGTWAKVNSLPCTDGFPNILNLSAGGSFSTEDKTLNGLEWVEGTFSLKNNDEITFSDLNEKSNSYQFRHFDKMAMITIHLSSECTLVYKKNL